MMSVPTSDLPSPNWIYFNVVSHAMPSWDARNWAREGANLFAPTRFKAFLVEL